MTILIEDLALRIESWLVTAGCSQDVGNYRTPGCRSRSWPKKQHLLMHPPWSSLAEIFQVPKQQTPWFSTQTPLVVELLTDVFYLGGKNPTTGEGLMAIGNFKYSESWHLWCDFDGHPFTTFTFGHPASIISVGFSNGFHCTAVDQLKVGDFHHEPRSFGVYGLTD